MARVVYYPEYHSEARVPGPASRMPAWLWQSPSTPKWQIFSLPLMARPHLTRAQSRGYRAPKVATNPGSHNTPKPLASIPPLSGAGRVISRGRFSAPSMSDPSSSAAACGRAY